MYLSERILKKSFRRLDLKLKKLILENKPEQSDTTKMRQHQCTTPSVQ